IAQLPPGAAAGAQVPCAVTVVPEHTLGLVHGWFASHASPPFPGATQCLLPPSPAHTRPKSQFSSSVHVAPGAPRVAHVPHTASPEMAQHPPAHCQSSPQAPPAATFPPVGLHDAGAAWGKTVAQSAAATSLAHVS